jgi:HSP20 family protein
MEQAFEKFFGKPLNAMQSLGDGKFLPTMDVAETEKEYVIHVDLPGVKSEDVKLEIHDDRLTVSGKRESEKKSEGKNYHRVERATGEFYRSVQLPQPIDEDKSVAEFADGVLTVKLPKSVKNQPRKIEIKSNAN